MGLGRAIDTQRDLLLRLVARLMLVVAVLSDARFDSAVTRWICRNISSVLSRAEAAAGYLVIASARLLAAQSLAVPRARRGKLGAVPCCGIPTEAGASYEGLLARLRVLKAMLETLPRYAERLLRREATLGYAGTVDGFSMAVRGSVAGSFKRLVCLPRIERPPDKFEMRA